MTIKLQANRLLGFRLTGSFDQQPQIGAKVGGKRGGSSPTGPTGPSGPTGPELPPTDY